MPDEWRYLAEALVLVVVMLERRWTRRDVTDAVNSLRPPSRCAHESPLLIGDELWCDRCGALSRRGRWQTPGDRRTPID
jgi:hypothetical protein